MSDTTASPGTGARDENAPGGTSLRGPLPGPGPGPVPGGGPGVRTARVPARGRTDGTASGRTDGTASGRTDGTASGRTGGSASGRTDSATPGRRAERTDPVGLPRPAPEVLRAGPDTRPAPGPEPLPDPRPEPLLDPGAGLPGPPGAATEVPDSGAAPSRLGNVLARAAAVTAGLTLAGALFGLVRDQAIARVFGASTESDAFLIAWTVPEMAATLLIEDAMALLLVPAFSQALARRAADRDAVRELVAVTLPRLLVWLACATGLLIVCAPLFVGVLAPGFADPGLAVDCTRLTALSVLTFGVAGYFSAALRAHGRFVPPAGVYVAYNAGIIATTLALHTLWGVRAAAAGVAVGGVLMILAQLPTFLRHVRTPRLTGRRRNTGRHARTEGRASTEGHESTGRHASTGGHAGIGCTGSTGPTAAPATTAAPASTRRGAHSPLSPLSLSGLAVLAPIVLFAVSRQSQVLVERFLASSLPGGAISHLNYAQKVAQMPMVLSLMFCTVTFPVVARAIAEGDRERARRRVENDLALAGLVVLLGTALILGYAPQIVEVLFERGAFDARDTETTATVMRVYAAGLLGHCLVGALGRPFFSSGRPTWYPAAAMAGGLVVTTVAGTAAVGAWGVYGIAAANALGITTTALLLLFGLGSRIVSIEVRAIARALGRLAVAASAAASAGWFAGPLTPDPLLGLAVGALLVPAVFIVTGLAVRAPEIIHLLDLTRQRIRHVR
ncbi:lipid II flippase MurJ [Streptomyces sp. NPDC055078]